MFGFKRRGTEREDICPEVPIKPETEGNEIAIVACGWFWGPQPRLQKMKGVARVVVGYSGGKQLNPNYDMMMDHTESVLIEFDPKVVTYEDILIEWSRMDYPYSKQKAQYRSAVFYMDEEQLEVAEEVVEGIKASASKGKKAYVDIEPVTRFYRGEEYHQNYLEKSRHY